MPAGPRIRSNSEFGLTTDNPLTAGATSFNSARLALMPVVSAAHAVVTLDPRAVNGEPEIVIITAHTAAATVATITRGAYGTVARSHPAATEWIHAPIDEDFIEILTSSTRPSDPYEGQFIFETNTNKLVGYGGVDWAPRDAGGQLGYAQIVGSVGGSAASFDVTGLSVAVTVGTGRRIKVSAHLPSISFGDTTSSYAFDIHQDGVIIGRSAFVARTVSTADASPANGSAIVSPSAGSHTYKVVATRGAGAGAVTVNASASIPSFILVEDIGAA